MLHAFINVYKKNSYIYHLCYDSSANVSAREGPLMSQLNTVATRRCNFSLIFWPYIRLIKAYYI